METTLREILDDSLRYWERGRLLYNAVLTAVVLFWLVMAWPGMPSAWLAPLAGALFLLAIIANVFYCAAYIADLPLQYSSYRGVWRRWRWVLWVVGTLIAVLLANFWVAAEIFPTDDF